MSEKRYRKTKIMEYCRDKNVLHLGFVQHNDWERKIQEGDWLHEKINDVAKRLIGIDYMEEAVEIIRDRYSYEVYYADVTNSNDMKRIRDKCKDVPIQVIICGELIPQVDNPGIMLDNIKMFMDKETILVITAPNPWSYDRVGLIKNGVYESEWLNTFHVSWYTHQTLKQLLERFGYREMDYGYYYSDREVSAPAWKRWIKAIIPLKRWNYPEAMYDGLFFVSKRS